MKVTVSSEETAKGIPSANITLVKPTGEKGGIVSCNADGQAILPDDWKSGSVLITHAEYNSVTISISKLTENIFLKPKNKTLEPVVVMAVRKTKKPIKLTIPDVFNKQAAPAPVANKKKPKIGYIAAGGIGLAAVAILLTMNKK